MYEVIVDPAAEMDLNEIFEWYEKQKQNLGYEFLLMFDECVATIERNPFHTYNISDNIRRASLKRFPYSVYYSIKDENVYVHVIMHQYRKPEEWQLRIK